MFWCSVSQVPFNYYRFQAAHSVTAATSRTGLCFWHTRYITYRFAWLRQHTVMQCYLPSRCKSRPMSLPTMLALSDRPMLPNSHTSSESMLWQLKRNVLESAATNKFAIANYAPLHSTSCTNPLNRRGYFKSRHILRRASTANVKLPLSALNAGRHMSEMIPHPILYENLKTPIAVWIRMCSVRIPEQTITSLYTYSSKWLLFETKTEGFTARYELNLEI